MVRGPPPLELTDEEDDEEEELDKGRGSSSPMPCAPIRSPPGLGDGILLKRDRPRGSILVRARGPSPLQF